MNNVNAISKCPSMQKCEGLNWASYTVKNTEPLLKALKIVQRFIEGGLLATNAVSKPCEEMTTHLKDSILFMDSIRTFGVIQMLSCPGKDGKYFLTNPENTWQKRVDRVALLFHCSFKSIKGLNKAGFVQMGRMSKEVIGKLPMFHLTMDAFILVSSFFGGWDVMINKKGLPPSIKQIRSDNDKIAKWEYRPLSIAYLRMNDGIERLEFLKKYEKKKETIGAKVEMLTTVLSQQEQGSKVNVAALPMGKLSDKVQKVMKACAANTKKCEAELTKELAKQVKNDRRLEMLYANDCRSLADELAQQQIYGEGGKVHKWEVIKQNDMINVKKNALRLANAIGKIVIVSIALVFTAMLGNAWTAPFIFSVLFIGNVADGIGLTKLIYEEFARPKPLPC